MIELGDQVKDKLTGFKGTVIGTTRWLNGCRRLVVQGTVLEKGIPVEAQTFDEVQLDFVKHTPLTQYVDPVTGGPRAAARPLPQARR